VSVADTVVTDPRLPAVVENGVARPRDVDEALPRRFRPGRHYVGWVCREAKAEFGALSRTKVNYDMVRRWVLRKMQSREMRPQHISYFLPRVVAFVFTISEQDLDARKFMMSEVVLERDRAFQEVFTDAEGCIIPEPFVSEE